MTPLAAFVALPMAPDAPLADTWTEFWGKVSGPLGGIVDIMTFVGVILVVGALLKYFWDRRRGGANTGQLLWAFGVGALLTLPTLLIPAILKLVDLLITAFTAAIG